jgi:hypothetical protein
MRSLWRLIDIKYALPQPPAWFCRTECLYSNHEGKTMVRTMSALNVVSATIQAGQPLSSSADCSNCDRIARIVMPPEWSGGASLTFQLSVDGVNFHDLHHVDPSTFYPFEIEVARPPVGGCITLPASMGTAVSFVKVRSGTRALPISQQADRTFQFIVETPS